MTITETVIRTGNPTQVGVGLPPLSRYGIPLPPHQTYVETQGSAGAALFFKGRSPVEVLNDSDGQVDNLCRVLREEQTRMRLIERYTRHMPGTRIISLGNGDDRVAKAINFATELERAVSLLLRTAFKKHQQIAVELEPELRGIDAALERLRGVQIEDNTLPDLLQRYDWSRALFVVDGRGLVWDDADGQTVAKLLERLKGTAILLTSGATWAEALPRWSKQPNDLAHSRGEELWMKL